MRLAHLLGAVGLAAALFPSSIVVGREPTEFEQYMLERLNFARANPVEEVVRLTNLGLKWGDDGTATPDLNEGLAAGTISSDPKQPLAFNLDLIESASNYSDTLLANGAFTHTFGGTTTKSRAEFTGYNFVPSWSVGENLAVTASSISLPITQSEVDEHHALLFIDGPVANRGHRTNIMNPAWREVGLGIRDSDSYTLRFDNCICPNAVLTTQDFAFTSAAGGGPYITGVAYRDVDVDGFYTPRGGEALGGLDVSVLLGGTGTLVASTTTLLSGGYKIEVDPGTYDLRFFGPGVDETYRGVVFDGTINLKLDAIDPGFNSLPADLTRNGFVDFADLTILLANWDKPVGAELGNLVMPEGTKVDFADLTVLLAAWTGSNAAGAPQAAAGAAAVPEPASWSLALIAMLAVIACPRRHNPLDARGRKH